MSDATKVCWVLKDRSDGTYLCEDEIWFQHGAFEFKTLASARDAKKVCGFSNQIQVFKRTTRCKAPSPPSAVWVTLNKKLEPQFAESTEQEANRMADEDGTVHRYVLAPDDAAPTGETGGGSV